MTKKIFRIFIVFLALVSITIIALVSLSINLNSVYYRGNWIWQGDVKVGCGGIGDECTWGTPDKNPPTDD